MLTVCNTARVQAGYVCSLTSIVLWYRNLEPFFFAAQCIANISTTVNQQQTCMLMYGLGNANLQLELIGPVSSVNFACTARCKLFFKVIRIRGSHLGCINLKMSKCAFSIDPVRERKPLPKQMQTKPLSSLLVCQKGLEILQHEYFMTELAEF